MNEITFDLKKIKYFLKKYYIPISISFFINAFIILLIYNSSLMKEINYSSVVSNIYYDKSNLLVTENKSKINIYTPTCGANDFFPLIYDINSYNTIQAINEFNKMLEIKLEKHNLYSAKTYDKNYFINIINTQSKYKFIPIRDKFAFDEFPDSQLKFYFDSNLSSLDNNYLFSFLMDFRKNEVSDSVSYEIKDIVVDYFGNVFNQMYNEILKKNKFLLDVAYTTTQNYLKEIENSAGYEKDSRLVNCLIKNKFNLKQINLLQSQYNNKNKHKLQFNSEISISDNSIKPSVEENIGLFVIPLLFFLLTILFCLYKFRSSKV